MTVTTRTTRIGIDYTPAYEQGGGIGRYVRELVAALSNVDQQTEYCLFVAGAGKQPLQVALPPLPGTNFKWAASRLSPVWFARLWHRACLPLPVEQWTGPVALYHATDFVLPPTLPKTRTVLTVHDLSFARAPEASSPALKRYLDRVVPRSVHRADHVLADSQATKNDLIALYDAPPDKITVLLSGVSERFKPVRDPALLAAVRAKYAIGDVPFILSVGTVQPRKNYERLMQAFAALPDQHRGLHLVIAGGRGWLQAPIYAAMDALGLKDRVHFIGFADDADLPALYSAARVFAFPSLYEGFGLPVLESMACGTPVVTSNVSSLVEVAGTAALMVDPLSVAQITHALGRLLNDADTEVDKPLRDTLIAAGFEQAASFTWERAARQLHTLYMRLLS